MSGNNEEAAPLVGAAIDSALVNGNLDNSRFTTSNAEIPAENSRITVIRCRTAADIVEELARYVQGWELDVAAVQGWIGEAVGWLITAHWKRRARYIRELQEVETLSPRRAVFLFAARANGLPGVWDFEAPASAIAKLFRRHGVEVRGGGTYRIKWLVSGLARRWRGSKAVDTFCSGATGSGGYVHASIGKEISQ